MAGLLVRQSCAVTLTEIEADPLQMTVFDFMPNSLILFLLSFYVIYGVKLCRFRDF